MPSFNFNPSSVLPSCRQKKLVTARALTFIFSSLGLLGITLASKSSRREIFWARAVCRLAGGLGGCGVLQTTDFKRKARPNQTPFEDTGEARGADARLLRMRTSRPSRHQAATARGGGGGGGRHYLGGEHVSGSGSKSHRSSSCSARPGLSRAFMMKMEINKQINK